MMSIQHFFLVPSTDSLVVLSHSTIKIPRLDTSRSQGFSNHQKSNFGVVNFVLTPFFCQVSYQQSMNQGHSGPVLIHCLQDNRELRIVHLEFRKNMYYLFKLIKLINKNYSIYKKVHFSERPLNQRDHLSSDFTLFSSVLSVETETCTTHRVMMIFCFYFCNYMLQEKDK